MPTDTQEVTIPDSLKAAPEPVDPVEEAVKAVKLDTTPYVMELAQAAQGYYHPEAPLADAMPYKEAAEQFFVFAQAGTEVYRKYQEDLSAARDKARQEAQEKLAADEQAKAQAAAEHAASVSRAQDAHAAALSAGQSASPPVGTPSMAPPTPSPAPATPA